MTFTAFFATVSCAILAIFAVGAFVRTMKSERRSVSKTTTFHCLRCDSVYISLKGESVENCPNCGYKNPKLKF